MDSKKHLYTLDPGSKKFRCPKCGKNRFVRYVNRLTGEYHPDSTYGRCERIENCQYLKTVPKGITGIRVDFLMSQSISEKAIKITEKNYRVHIVPKSVVMELGNKYAFIAEWFLQGSALPKTGESKEFSDGRESMNTMVSTPNIKEVEPSYHDPEDLNLAPVICNLTKWLLTVFEPQQVEAVKSTYMIQGIDRPWKGSTCYFQVDETGKIHGVKIMHVSPVTGNRTKEPYPRINWLHRVLKMESFVLSQCLYGLHLINERPNADIVIAEGERTAIYMSILEPNKIWLACGSVTGIKESLLQPIKNRRIVLSPDRGCYDDWKAKASKLNEVGFNTLVSDFLESKDLPDGSDLLDYYERIKTKR